MSITLGGVVLCGLLKPQSATIAEAFVVRPRRAWCHGVVARFGMLSGGSGLGLGRYESKTTRGVPISVRTPNPPSEKIPPIPRPFSIGQLSDGSVRGLWGGIMGYVPECRARWAPSGLPSNITSFLLVCSTNLGVQGCSKHWV